MKVLGIETSCDETAAAVVEDGAHLLSNVVASQVDIHAQYGGVVPEVAARSHIEVIVPVVEQALTEAECSWDDIDAIAVTYGPGLSGSLLIGTLTARTLALLKQKPLLPINHVEGHVYANFLLNPQPAFPLLALIVSGGHSQLVLFNDHFDYRLLGQTQDDAIGEAFDKVAKVIGLSYPGGPAIAEAATHGDAHKYDFPKAKMSPREIRIPPDWVRTSDGSGMRGDAETRTESYQAYDDGATEAATKQTAPSRQTSGGSADDELYTVRGSYDFSFSGLKTAVLRKVQAICGKDHAFPSFELAELLSTSQVNDIAASFQRVAVETVVEKTKQAYDEFSPAAVVIAGGVAASQELRTQLQAAIPQEIAYAAPNLCTDNAAMIATLGYYKATAHEAVDPHELSIEPSLSM